MSEAPKILWYCDQECSAGPVKFAEHEVKYIRADPPLNGDQIIEGFKELGFSPEEYRLRCFTEGVRFAERMRNDD